MAFWGRESNLFTFFLFLRFHCSFNYQGVDTSTSVLTSFVLVMLNNPGIQSKIQQEIDSAVGDERMPTIADRDHMPYTNATIMEVQRYASVFPIGLSRNTTQSTEVMGLAIPKDTQVSS